MAPRGGAYAPKIEMEGVFPLPLNVVWRLFDAHLDEVTIHEIHPWIESGRVLRVSETQSFDGRLFPREKVVERDVRILGRRFHTTWRYEIEPPRRFAYEMRFANGSASSFDNVYAAAPGGTHVKTTGHVAMKGVPAFLASWATRRLLVRADKEDLAYAQKIGVATDAQPKG